MPPGPSRLCPNKGGERRCERLAILLLCLALRALPSRFSAQQRERETRVGRPCKGTELDVNRIDLLALIFLVSCSCAELFFPQPCQKKTNMALLFIP